MQILFEDAHLIAVIKPAGLSTQAPPIAGETLEALVRRHLDPEHPESAYVGTIHRLDRPVSGVVLWAKNPRAARRLSQQFERRRVGKEYWAILEGRPSGPDQGVWEDWLCFDETGLGRVQVVAPGTPRARQARTQFRIEPGATQLPPDCSWVRLWPETGRTHQLRIQSSSRGAPILGDHLYEGKRPFPVGIALHAHRLEVRHPVTQEALAFEAPPPPAWHESGIVVP